MKDEMQLYRFKLEADDRELRLQIEGLEPRLLKSLLKAFNGDVSNIPLDVFVRERVPADDADGADKIVVGFKLRLGFDVENCLVAA